MIGSVKASRLFEGPRGGMKADRKRVVEMIRHYLNLSRIEAGGISMSTEPVGVMDVVEEVRTTLESIASRQSIALSTLPPTATVPTPFRTPESRVGSGGTR